MGHFSNIAIDELNDFQMDIALLKKKEDVIKKYGNYELYCEGFVPVNELLFEALIVYIYGRGCDEDDYDSQTVDEGILDDVFCQDCNKYIVEFETDETTNELYCLDCFQK